MKHAPSSTAAATSWILLVAGAAAGSAQSQVLGNASIGWPERFEDAWGAAAADVDGDGDLDVFLAQDGLNRLFLHRSGGVFVEADGGLPGHAEPTVDGAWVDVNGDGAPDLITANFDAQNRLYLNDGSGQLIDATAGLPSDMDRSVDLSTGDVDGDGDADVLVGNSTSQQNRLLLNLGDGTFADATAQLPFDADRTVELLLADLDGDGDLDALAANDLGNRKYLNLGAGLFVDASGDLPMEADSSYGLGVADVDGDGDLDAVIGNLAGVNRLHRNDGLGRFQDDPGALPQSTSSTYVVRFLDIDGDADADLLLGNGGGADELYENDGSGDFSDISSRLPDSSVHTRALVCEDWDGDGDLDVLATTVFEERDVLLRNEAASFRDVTAGDDLQEGAFPLALGDVDSDGDLDAVGLETPSLDFSLQTNDGSGRFTSVPGALPPELRSGPAFADLDDDGTLDLLVGSDDMGQARMFLGEGAGAFTDATSRLPVAPEHLGPTLLGDLDGDGDVDAYLGNAPGISDPGQDRVYLNDGAGLFTDSGGVPIESDGISAAELSDLDGDGDLDVLIAAGQQGKRLLRNNGAASFADASSGLPNTTNNSFSLSIGDVDGDGDQDAYFGVFGTDELYLNDGGGTFSDVSSTHLPTIFIGQAPVLADLDDDGDLDLLVQHLSLEGPFGLFAYRNDGAGHFDDWSEAVPSTPVASTGLFADLDGDDDRDLLLQGRALFGWRRQASAVGASVRGRALELELHGPPNSPWILAYSNERTRIDVAPFGHLFLEPASMVEIATGSLASDGADTLRVDVPGDPVVAGSIAYVQGAMGMPLRLSNLEILTLQ